MFRYEASFFPYLGAKCIGSKEEFYNIFKLSKDFDTALRKFFSKNNEDCEQFYKIKNKS